MPKRRTKAQIAREAGLEPLALSLLENPCLDPSAEAAKYLNDAKEIKDAAAALDGAKQIVMEIMAEDAQLLEGTLFENICAFRPERHSETALGLARDLGALALFRGQKEGVLQLRLTIDPVDDNGQATAERSVAEGMIARRFSIADEGRPADSWLMDTARWAWRIKLSTHLDLELKRQLREAAEAEAIEVFARNL